MDGFELNKIAGAVLFTLLVYIGIQNLGDVLFHVEPANPQAYVVEGVELAVHQLARQLKRLPKWIFALCCKPRLLTKA